MKLRIEVECTPVEARAFFGLPDVTPINDRMVAEIDKRLVSNAAMLDPETLMRSWFAFGGQAQDSFFKLMTTAMAGGTSKPSE